MAKSILTDQDPKPLHPLVRALQKKGYTKIKITWGHALSLNRGYKMETEQIDYKHLGYTLKTAKEKINALPEITQTKQS